MPPNLIRFGQPDPDGEAYDPPAECEVAGEGCGGGCATGSGAGLPGALGVVGLALLRRRRGA